MNGSRRVFVTLTSAQMSDEVAHARERVALAASGVSCNVATALADARLRGVRVAVVLDCNDDVCRLGYSQVEAVRHLVTAGIVVGQSPGLRAGVLIVDERAWAFTPTPLSVERERQSDETPNAVRLNRSQARELLAALAPQVVTDQLQFFPAQPEIGATPLAQTELKKVEKSLEETPPLNFDLQRQVRVFQPYIQYVELSLVGCSIGRHTVTLPTSLAPLAKQQAVQARLRTTYNLISEKSKLSDKHLQDELTAIRKAFARHIKPLGGSVMLRGKRPQIDARLKTLEEKVEKHKELIRKSLQREIDASLIQLRNALLPLVHRNPPDDLLNGCMAEKPTREDAKRWLEHELRKVFPTPEQVVKEIELKCVFKDVTYESLNRADLRVELKKAFPAVPWEKPFSEFDAAKADPERPDNHPQERSRR